MKRLALLALCALLGACGSGTTANGGRPDINPPTDTDAEADIVKFPAAPSGAPVYLAFVDAEQKVRGTLSIPASSTKASLNVSTLRSYFADVTRAKPLSLVPEEARATAAVTGAAANVVVLSLVMYQDKNTNSVLDAGEALALRTHDLVVYSDAPFTLQYNTADPAMQHQWKIESGLTRAEHFVYRPKVDGIYRRSMTSSALLFELHRPTPITSQ